MVWCELKRESFSNARIDHHGSRGLDRSARIFRAHPSNPRHPRSILRAGTLIALLLILSTAARAQSGVLIPSSTEKPDPAVLSLDEMSVNILIDNQYARVRVTHIFGNHTERVQEGRYVFLIPTTAAISDFAVWDGDVRIPGVILEKKRADEIYKDLALQNIDPGLLKQERDDTSNTAFTVQITPIPAYGTKRLELEYTEALSVDNLESYFSFPFKPGDYGTQPVAHLSLCFWACGAPERITADELRDPRLAEREPDGYFEAAAVFNQAGRAPGETAPPPPRPILRPRAPVPARGRAAAVLFSQPPRFSQRGGPAPGVNRRRLRRDLFS